MAKRFPAKLFVKVEEDGDTSYFVTADDISEFGIIGETVKVAVYQLVETTFLETTVKTSGAVKKR
jgi:hypothetical protein